jgi:hypothetical protein
MAPHSSILPGTGRWQSAGLTEGSHLCAKAVRCGEAGPLPVPGRI